MICDENEENNLSQQIVESGVKSRKISIFKEFLRHDKNIICLPWQHLPFPNGRIYYEGAAPQAGAGRGVLCGFCRDKLGGDLGWSRQSGVSAGAG